MSRNSKPCNTPTVAEISYLINILFTTKVSFKFTVYMMSFVNYNRYHIGDFFTNNTSMGLEDLLSSGSLHSPLSTIKTDGQVSDPVPVLSPVPQGSVLGRPVLFLISVNDLPYNIRSYGDCILCRNINSLSIGRFYKMTCIALHNFRLIGK